MNYEKFEISLIIPFRYKKTHYDIFETLDRTELSNVFRKVSLSSSRINAQNIDLWKNGQRGIMCCLELQQGCRKRLGLSNDERCTYTLKKQETLAFKIGKVYGWFLESGEAFLTLHVKAKELSGDQVLDLRKLLTDVKADNEIKYCVKSGPDTTETKVLTLIQLIQVFFQLISQLEPEKQEKTLQDALSLSYGIVRETNPEKISIFSANMQWKTDSTHKVQQVNDTGCLYIPEKFPYLYWMITEDSLVLTADIQQAEKMSEKNGEFLRANLGPSIFRDYMKIYLYYIALLEKTIELERQFRNASKNISVYPPQRKIRSIRRDLVRITDQFHINTLFLEYLCGRVWRITERLDRLEADSECDVFISYRRRYGGYVAKLIYDKLTSNGVKVFYDRKSMRAGNFPEQLANAMKPGMYVVAVLTPGCLDERPEQKTDYVREELRRALDRENHITVITMVVDDFTYPKEFPEGLENLDKQHGIHIMAENLDASLDALVELLRRSES